MGGANIASMTHKAMTSPPSKRLSGPEPFDIEPHSLGGTYRVRALDSVVEVEMVETSSLWRSVLYVRSGQDLTVFIPSGTYGLFLRSITGGDPRIDIRRMSGLQRLGFYIVKALSLLGRPPLDSIAILKRLLRPEIQTGRIEATTVKPAAKLLVEGKAQPLKPQPEPVAQPVSIIIPTKTREDLLDACIASLDRIEGVPFEIIIIDNGAERPQMLALLERLGNRSDTRIIRLDIPFNFSKLCNAGADIARYDRLLFLNDDVEARDGAWLANMSGFLARADTGIVGARLLYPSGDLQHAGIASHLTPGPGHPFRGVPREIWEVHPLLNEARFVDAVTGACLLAKREVFKRVGGFNERDFGISLNDVDLCLRVREVGLEVIYAPQATLIHKESQSRRDEGAPQEQVRYRRELAAYYHRHPQGARLSDHYPTDLRRDTDAGLRI